jgi:TrmH RNA methyltransferase
VYGLRAAIAVLETRADDVRELRYDRAIEHVLSEILAFARQRRIAVSVHSESELKSFARTHNHEGLVLVTTPRRWLAARDLSSRLTSARSTLGRPGAAVALDRVRNAYNIGAILRSAAFFGLDAVLFGSRAPEPDLPEDAVRVAEGGAEHLALARTTDLADTLSRLRAAGVKVVGAESDGAVDAIGYRFDGPTILVLGHEREGLSERVRAQCDAMVCIRGGGAVESLNVAIAASLMISELVRGRSSETKAIPATDAKASPTADAKASATADAKASSAKPGHRPTRPNERPGPRDDRRSKGR